MRFPLCCRMAPELMEGGQATTKSDTWAFGCVLYELLTWRLPWHGYDTPFQVRWESRRCMRPVSRH